MAEPTSATVNAFFEAFPNRGDRWLIGLGVSVLAPLLADMDEGEAESFGVVLATQASGLLTDAEVRSVRPENACSTLGLLAARATALEGIRCELSGDDDGR